MCIRYLTLGILVEEYLGHTYENHATEMGCIYGIMMSHDIHIHSNT